MTKENKQWLFTCSLWRHIIMSAAQLCAWLPFKCVQPSARMHIHRL